MGWKMSNAKDKARDMYEGWRLSCHLDTHLMESDREALKDMLERALQERDDEIERLQQQRNHGIARGAKEVIGEACGSVSMCWEPKPTGVFDSSKAIAFCDEAFDKLSFVFSNHIEKLTTEITKLKLANAELVAVLKDISVERDFVESQSTGSRQYFPTNGALLAQEYLSKHRLEGVGE